MVSAPSEKREKEIVGFENMSSVHYDTVYPLTARQFVRRSLITFTKVPASAALLSMAIQHVMCDYDESFSFHNLFIGFDDDAVNHTGTFKVGFLRDFSPVFHFCLFVAIVRMTTALMCHSFYWYIEKYNKLSEYKIPRPPQIVPSDDLRWDNYKSYAIEFLTAPLSLWFVTHFHLVKHVNPVCQPISFLPTFFFILGSLFLNETGFYWVHRLLHEVPFLYRTIHKKHHKYIGSISIAAEYANPLETIFSSIIPLFFLTAFVPVAPIVFALWVVFRLFETYESHSGYCFDGSFLSQKLNMTHSGYTLFHDFHHVVNKGNYGQGGIFWDYICGSDKLFRQKVAAARDRVQNKNLEAKTN